MLEILTNMSGTSSDITNTLSNSDGIFNTITNSVQIITNEIGTVSSPILSLVLNLQVKIKTLLGGLNLDSLNINFIEETVSTIASILTELIATVSAVTRSAPSNGPDSLYEAIISLQIVLSSLTLVVNYTVQLAVTIVFKVRGSVSNTLQQIAISISVSFRSISSIVSEITNVIKGATDLTLILRSVVSRITVTLTTITKTITVSLSSIIRLTSSVTINLTGSFGAIVSNAVETLSSLVGSVGTDALDQAFNVVISTLNELRVQYSVRVVGNLILQIQSILKTLITWVSKINQSVCSNAKALQNIVDTINSYITQLQSSTKELVDGLSGLVNVPGISANEIMIIKGTISFVITIAGNVSTYVTGILQNVSHLNAHIIRRINIIISSATKRLASSINDNVNILKASVRTIRTQNVKFSLRDVTSSLRGALTGFSAMLSQSLSKANNNHGKFNGVGLNNGLINNLNRIRERNNNSRKRLGLNKSIFGLENNSSFSSALQLTSGFKTLLDSLSSNRGNFFNFKIRDNGCKRCRSSRF